MDWRKFLSGMPANDYVVQDIPYEEQIKASTKLIKDADYILIGAGAGLSTAAGMTYSGRRFEDNFGEFIKKYGVTDMYSAGFYPFPSEEAMWGYWSKNSYINCIEPAALPLYKKLFNLIKNKKYFVLTTNVDRQFHKAGFDENKIFATQGDYSRIQCMRGCHKKIYDATKMFIQMNQAIKDCLIPAYMVPKCPVCGGPMAMHLRCDEYFVEDKMWDKAAQCYANYIDEIRGHKVLLLELGVGFNTPTIIRFPFEKMVRENNSMSLVRINYNEAFIPQSFGTRAIGINADLSDSIEDIEKMTQGGGYL